MKRILTAIAILSALSSAAAAQPPATRPAHKHPVEAFFAAGIEAFNAHDLERFVTQFSDDVQMYTPTGWLRGKAAVRGRFQSTFEQFPDVRMEVADLRVQEVSPGTAIVDFNWKVYPMGRGPAFHGVGSGVYVVRDNRWVEVLEHETVTKVDEGLNSNRK